MSRWVGYECTHGPLSTTAISKACVEEVPDAQGIHLAGVGVDEEKKGAQRFIGLHVQA
jgi:hypothetical protein